ncbi:NAD-dependent epimerase/dehydratase family protein [Bdellovibrio svalbardensis]|uniref:NAD-dependent epimerase/dehydratase family protein n=1 Tax=Bdellovibrio svalbardensis TaxID=2972972 RepID=A0ABT6DG12_9BACT|nr:NAD-dependent epimerase/dehydratase family protein [Bdellovibrio svalbardensis]MDG0814801.1 NAD-dependent epimerase/dehydratase family protein [Bdellovibrio svalbardensis]
MKVLVTGANGFLGSWVTRALVDEGHEVFALVRPNADVSELHGVNCKFVHGDVTDILSLLEAFKGIDTVFHLAGVIAYKKSERAKMEKVNVHGTANVIEVCRECKVRRMVYLSSVVAIGSSRSDDQVLNEGSDFNVHDLDLGYFETKHKAEELVKKACDRGELDAVILNPSTVYGPGDAKKGSRKMQVKVAQGRFKFYTSGGVNVVAVEDVVQGILSAWKKGKKGERYILAGENIRIKDLFTMIANEAGVTPPPHHLPDQVIHVVGAVGDCLERIGMKGPLSRENAWTATMYHWFDSSKAQQELDFKPRPAREAIHNSVQWMKEHGLLS